MKPDPKPGVKPSNASLLQLLELVLTKIISNSMVKIIYKQGAQPWGQKQPRAMP
jgi:hypothetical protein